MREVVFGVALPVILPVFMGLDGVLWAFPVSDVLTGAADLWASVNAQ